MKYILLCLFLAGCDHPYYGTPVPIEMKVIEVYKDKSTWGCVGTGWKTLVRSDDGRTAHLCDRWGKPGDVISGCWVTDATDHSFNGFRRICG